MSNYILGAGLAGLIQSVVDPTSVVLEQTRDFESMKIHRAVLRFRSENISNITGISFDKIEVSKSIYYKGDHYNQCNPQLANLYSSKVTGTYIDRSIWKLDKVVRYLAPHDFHERLFNLTKSRIKFDSKIKSIKDRVINLSIGSLRYDGYLISTIPLPILLKSTNIPFDFKFESKNISVTRYRLPKGSRVNQTIYYPDPQYKTYRTSIENDILIIESIDKEDLVEEELNEIFSSLGIWKYDCEFIDKTEQLGKITPINEKFRKESILNMTLKHNIYSLGRYATWKNVVLDEVYHDMMRIKKLVSLGHYDLINENFKEGS